MRSAQDWMTPRSEKCVGEVDLFASDFGERCDALMGDDADDLDLLWFGRTQADEDVFADGGLAGEGFGGQVLVDDYAVASGKIVVVSEGAASKRAACAWLQSSREERFENRLPESGLGRGPRLRYPSEWG